MFSSTISIAVIVAFGLVKSSNALIVNATLPIGRFPVGGIAIEIRLCRGNLARCSGVCTPEPIDFVGGRALRSAAGIAGKSELTLSTRGIRSGTTRPRMTIANSGDRRAIGASTIGTGEELAGTTTLYEI